MPNKSYWEIRQEQKYLVGEMKIIDYYKGLERAFKQARREMQSVINDFYVKYAEENGVSYADAQKLLSRAEIEDLKDFIERIDKVVGMYNLELNNMSIKARMTRYEALEKQIDAILQQLYTVEYQYKGEELLRDVYTDTYYQTWFNIDQYHGFHQEFAQIDPRVIEELIKYPFNGANYSTRIWKQKDHMLQQLNESITTMIIQGKNPSTLSKDFAKKFGSKEFDAYRLLHTEGSFIMEQATLRGYEEDGVEQYRILATLDHKTSDICRGEDGKVYKVKDAVVGVNYPPYHIFCRTTTTPYYEDSDYSEDTRMARDPVTGKPYEVPANMNYTEWHKKYIESNPEAITAEKKWKNRHNDRTQYERYRGFLGKDLGVKSLDDFQNLKYNNSEDYRLVKVDYSRRKRLIDNPELKLPNIEKATIADEKFTKYLFDGVNKNGLNKGRLITKRLGYNISNYKEFKADILKRAAFNPSIRKADGKYGAKYEQQAIFYNKDMVPTNAIIGWQVQGDKTHLSTIYVKEVKD